MKLIDGIKEIGCPFKIPNCNRSELPEFFKQMGYKVGAEIGVYKGQFTEMFCQAGLYMYAIDNWKAYEVKGVKLQKQSRQDAIYEHAKRRLGKYKNCKVIRENSMDAVADFNYDSLDFVYIDADHMFRGIANDIYEWYLRVKSGGVVSGHDYAYTGTDKKAAKSFETYCHVPMIVDAFVRAFNIDNFYTFGRTKPLEKEQKNDINLSWMFLKK